VLASPDTPCTLPNVSLSKTLSCSICHLFHVTNTPCSRRRRPTPPRRSPRPPNLRRTLTRTARLDRRQPRRKSRQRRRRTLAHLRTDPLPIARRLPRHARRADDCVSSLPSTHFPLLVQENKILTSTSKTDSFALATSSRRTHAWTCRPATPALLARLLRARLAFVALWIACRVWRLVVVRRAEAMIVAASRGWFKGRVLRNSYEGMLFGCAFLVIWSSSSTSYSGLFHSYIEVSNTLFRLCRCLNFQAPACNSLSILFAISSVSVMLKQHCTIVITTVPER
jgi:hypothetical protein